MGISLQHAKAEQKRCGFKSYAGPKLAGQRHELDIRSKVFPQALVSIPHPPKKLYVIGALDALCDGLAIIGARRATPYGLACAYDFAYQAARSGVVVISGGARGCDAQAHRGALDAKGRTVVFLGGGADQLYPASHYGLFQQIIDAGGAIVSEHEWDYPAIAYTFRQRNRLIAGLSKATLIVEAGLPSGTFSTADEALDANKEVLVIPGAITSPTSAGSNQLLYQGATPIINNESFKLALTSLFGTLHNEVVSEAQNNTIKDPMLAALLAAPMRLEDIFETVQPPQGKGSKRERLHVRLVELEAQGIIARYPDGRYGPATRNV